jgi:hypothetical protein
LLFRLDGEQAGRPVEERRRRRRFLTIERATPCVAEQPAALERKGARVVVNAPEFGSVAVRLLEVVADDLVVPG